MNPANIPSDRIPFCRMGTSTLSNTWGSDTSLDSSLTLGAPSTVSSDTGGLDTTDGRFQHSLFPDPKNKCLTEDYECVFGHSEKDLNELQPFCKLSGRCHRYGHLLWGEQIKGLIVCAKCQIRDDGYVRDHFSCVVCAHQAYRRSGGKCCHCANHQIQHDSSIRPYMDKLELAEKLLKVLGNGLSGQLSEVVSAIDKYGPVLCIQAYHRVVAMTAQGGVLTANGVRFRQGLGLWWGMLRGKL